MINNNDKNIEKICLFFASDYHFEMISLPYINKKLKENKKVIIMTENNLKTSIDKLLSMLTLSEEEKAKIKEIEWDNNEVKKYEAIEFLNKENQDIVVFIKGKEEYIEKSKEKINSIISNNQIKIVDCYNVSELQEKSKCIAEKYDKILSTSGIEIL